MTSKIGETRKISFQAAFLRE